MKPKLPHLLVFAATLQAFAGSPERALYLEPSPNAPVIARVAPDDAAVTAAVPALGTESKSSETWLWTEYRGTFTVFVPDEAVSKNFEVDPGTPARLQADNSAPVLTRIATDDPFEVLSNQAGWTQLKLTKSIPLYLRETASSTPAPTPPAITPPPPPKPLSPAPSVPGSRFDPSVGVGTAPPSTLPPENTVWVPTGEAVRPAEPSAGTGETGPAPLVAPDSEGIVVGPEAIAALRAPQNPEQPPGASTRTLAGTLERSLPSAFGGPRYPLRLNAPGRSKRIAYVDLSRLFIRDLRPYLGRSVHVTGEVRSLVPGSEELVILARTIRILD